AADLAEPGQRGVPLVVRAQIGEGVGSAVLRDAEAPTQQRVGVQGTGRADEAHRIGPVHAVVGEHDHHGPLPAPGGPEELLEVPELVVRVEDRLVRANRSDVPDRSMCPNRSISPRLTNVSRGEWSVTVCLSASTVNQSSEWSVIGTSGNGAHCTLARPPN